MSYRVQITGAFIMRAAQTSTARKALREKADKLAARADAIGSAEGVEMDCEVKEGTRPKGRPYARVESDQVSQEYGDRYTERRRILGRTAGGA